MKHLKAEPARATQLINEKIVKMHTVVYRGQYGWAVHIKHLFQYIFPHIFHKIMHLIKKMYHLLTRRFLRQPQQTHLFNQCLNHNVWELLFFSPSSRFNNSICNIILNVSMWKQELIFSTNDKDLSSGSHVLIYLNTTPAQIYRPPFDLGWDHTAIWLEPHSLC